MSKLPTVDIKRAAWSGHHAALTTYGSAREEGTLHAYNKRTPEDVQPTDRVFRCRKGGTAGDGRQKSLRAQTLTRTNRTNRATSSPATAIPNGRSRRMQPATVPPGQYTMKGVPDAAADDAVWRELASELLAWG
jgi:hypothetical protein